MLFYPPTSTKSKQAAISTGRSAGAGREGEGRRTTEKSKNSATIFVDPLREMACDWRDASFWAMAAELEVLMGMMRYEVQVLAGHG